MKEITITYKINLGDDEMKIDNEIQRLEWCLPDILGVESGEVEINVNDV